MTRRAVDWMFRSRADGRITIAQRPNVALALFLVAAVVGVLLHPAGTAGSVVRVLGTGALVVWAADEVVRGVNPWRRLLGASVLAWEALRWLSR